MKDELNEDRPIGRPDPHGPPSTVAQENIRTVARLERQAVEQRSLSERSSEVLTRVMGSMGFVLFQVALFAAWFSINLGLLPFLEPFDPFPFGVLTLIVSAEGVFLAIFVLISQNRMSREANHRAHLDLQVSMLAEAEATKTLALLQDLSRHLGCEPRISDEELEKLAQPTDLPALAQELKHNLKVTEGT